MAQLSPVFILFYMDMSFKGKAVSQWVHVRNWPLVIRSLVRDIDSPVVTLGLLLHEIVERVTAQEYYPYEVDILEDKTVEYLNLRKAIRSEYPSLMTKCKPKHHFIREHIHGNLITFLYLILNFLEMSI